jgi:hypothetical protein
MLISIHSDPAGGYVVQAQDGRRLSVSTDWDFPPLAKAFGWNGRFSKRTYGSSCDGRLRAARDWLDKHLGKTAEDPGYFEGEPQQPLTVELSASTPGVKGRIAEVGSLREASGLARQFINQQGIAARAWTGGTVRQGKQAVARVSYDGRVTSVDRTKTALYTPSRSTSRQRCARPKKPACRCQG